MTILALALLGRGVVDVATPVAYADDTGLTRGDGCFEGLRIHLDATGGAVIDEIDGHLDRLDRSASALDIPCDRAAWRDLATSLAAAWAEQFSAHGEAAMKLVLTRGRPGTPSPTGFATVSAPPDNTLETRRVGIDVVTLTRGVDSGAFAGTPWLLGGIKTLSYAVNMAAQREAERRGAHDAVFVSRDGWLLEAPTSSVVWFSAGTLRTVADGTNGILASITLGLLFRRAAEAGMVTEEGRGTVADLRAAEAVMLVSSVRGPVRVRAIDGTALAETPRGAELVGECQALTGFV